MSVNRAAEYIDSRVTIDGVPTLRARTMHVAGQVNGEDRLAKGSLFLDPSNVIDGVPTLRMRAPAQDEPDEPADKVEVYGSYLDAFGVRRWRTSSAPRPPTCLRSDGLRVPCYLQKEWNCSATWRSDTVKLAKEPNWPNAPLMDGFVGSLGLTHHGDGVWRWGSRFRKYFGIADTGGGECNWCGNSLFPLQSSLFSIVDDDWSGSWPLFVPGYGWTYLTVTALMEPSGLGGPSTNDVRYFHPSCLGPCNSTIEAAC